MNRLMAPDRPDWRWARVADLSQYSNTAALARLRDEDELTRRAYEFRRALDCGMGGRFPELDAAYDLFMNRPDTRLQIECLMISGADDELIADASMNSPEVIGLYHDLFFWVRPGLDKPIWLNSAVFGGMPQANAHPTDIHGTALRLAMKIGHKAMLDLLALGLCADTTVQQLRNMTHEVMLTQVAMLSFSAGVGREMPEWVGRVLDQKDAGAGGGGGDFDQAIDAFFQGLAISVADPTDERNLKLPAREERVTEYEVVNDA